MTASRSKRSKVDLKRCWWCGTDPLYVRYHDEEWGKPVSDDRRLFEKICLEGFQAGLSWLTILRKRENFRRAFADFRHRPRRALHARKTSRACSRTKASSGTAARSNRRSTTRSARSSCEKRRARWPTTSGDGSPSRASRPRRITREVLKTMATTPESTALSKDLRKRGWTFVGPTTVYAFMQAMGLVNDHVDDCSFDNCNAQLPRTVGSRELGVGSSTDR